MSVSPAAFALVLLAAQAGKQVNVIEARLHQFEDGPPLAAPHRFAPGDPVFVSWRISGYEKTGGENPRVKLDWTVHVFDSENRKVVESRSGNFDTELAPQDKNWNPKARHDFVLPPLIDPGGYKVVIEVADGLNKTNARRELPFTIAGLVVEKSDSLVARNFRFLRTEQDGEPLKVPSYRPGDALWARFEITGYKLGPSNAYAVSYGLEVLRPTGEQVYAEPNAATEADRSFYPKRYVPGILNLNLNKDLAKGDYTIVLRLRDDTGKQSAESRHVFTVE